MMYRLSRRQSLALGPALALTIALVILAILEQWVFFALAGVAFAAAISTLLLLTLGNLRSLARDSANVRKRVDGLEKKLVRIIDRQDRIRALTDKSRRDFIATTEGIRSDLQELDSQDSAVLDKVSHAERRLVGIVEALRLEIGDLATAADR